MNNAELLDKLKEMVSELQKPCEECQEFNCYGCNIKADISKLQKLLNEVNDEIN